MATTESRPGFRLPWTTDRPVADETAGGDPHEADASAAGGSDPVTSEARPADPNAGFGGDVDPGPMPDPRAVVTDSATPAGGFEPRGPAESASTAVRGRDATRRRSNAFLAELTRAMHAAALEARERVLEQFRAESKTFMEELHARSAEEVAALRRAADADVAAIRDWSKAEIARIREETERRITDRKTALEEEVEAQAARIEGQIEHLQGAVGAFEAEMDRFFEQLLAVEDPTQFAALAANLPEPPPFEAILAEPAAARPAAPTATGAGGSRTIAEPTETVPEPTETVSKAAETVPPGTDAVLLAAKGEPADLTEPPELDAGALEADAAALDRAPEAALALESTWASAAAERRAGHEATADGAEPATSATEPTADGGAAEADGLDELDDSQIAARLAGLLGTREVPPAPPTQPVTTTVAVAGLVSVASIAGFKRHLAHLPGVGHVGVASGPSGDFVFTVRHDPELDLAAAVASLPDFEARITGSSPGSLTVTAHDPDLSA